MNWFDWPFGKDPATQDAPQALIADVEKRGKQYLEDVDNGKWVYPACKRTSSDAGADEASICDHTRLEAVRYLLMVPRREFTLLAEPDSQKAILDAYLRQLPHDETVIEFTGNTMSDLAIAVIAGFNWLNHCAVLAGADRDKFSGTLSNFRKLTGLAQQWWTMDGAAERCGQMLAERENPPLMLFLIWTEYTRLAKEVAAAALFGSSIERATERRREILKSKLAGRPDELNSALDELAETMASFERARDPDDLMG